MNSPLYRISGWSRRRDQTLGTCCFCISLDARFAEKARALPFDKQQRFEELVREIIGYKYARATFLDGTALLRSMSVEGNCACLGISGTIVDSDWSDRRSIEYAGHNVDSKGQAFDLLTIFTFWVDTVEALLR